MVGFINCLCRALLFSAILLAIPLSVDAAWASRPLTLFEQAHVNVLRKYRPDLADRLTNRLDKLEKQLDERPDLTPEQKDKLRKEIFDTAYQSAVTALETAKKLGTKEQQRDAQFVAFTIATFRDAYLDNDFPEIRVSRVADEVRSEFRRLQDEKKKQAQAETSDGIAPEHSSAGGAFDETYAGQREDLVFVGARIHANFETAFSDSDPLRFQLGRSYNDYGGGNEFATQLANIYGDEFVGNGYQTGKFSGKFAPLDFELGEGLGVIKFHGESNSAIVTYDNDNPNRDETYWGTSAATPTYAGFHLGVRFPSSFFFGANLEASFANNRLDLVRDNNTSDDGCDSREPDDNVCLYTAEGFVGFGGLGKLNFGLGETAFAGLHSLTLGGIAHVTNAQPNLRAGEHEVFGLGSNFGWFMPSVEGVQRAERVKYTSPTLAGFSLAASFGEPDHVGARFDAEDDYWDVALRYAGEFGGFRVASGIGYQDVDRVGGASQENLTGSASIQHIPTGIFATANLTSMNRDGNGAPGINETDDAFAFYLHAGIRQTWFDLGSTAIYGEFGSTSDGQSAGDYFLDGSETQNFGLGIVQDVDCNYFWRILLGDAAWPLGIPTSSVYLTYNHIEAQRDGFDAEDTDIVMIGIRSQF